MIIDATNLILGRFATVVAKKSLQGEQIDIVNCEKAVIVGKKEKVLAKYRNTRERGAPLVGPYFPRMTDRFVRRTIRGMIPYKQPKGKEAFKRIMCYKGTPIDLQNKKIETIKEANVSRLSHTKYLTVETICKFLGGK
ncbi:MAG: 50S ribosomal protein L13 [Nanoarchaeota archaeon]|nr:50S ribosomal protein L13 [Nanoarchaeota archaeon]MBU1854845.1 50S ribosomal protein L13 [Nanoarchaeota archaeon]